MKKIIALCLLLFFVSGCQFGLFQRKDTMILPEIKIGTQGVELFFDPITLPREVYENSKFTMLVTLSNLGAFDVEKGVYSISYEPQYVYLPMGAQQGFYDVRGKSEFMPGGMEKQISLPFETKTLGPQLQGYTTTITFNTCYQYQTNAPLIVCIDPDVAGKNPDKVCISRPQTLGGGQGAPVAITAIEPRMIPHDMPERIMPEFVLTLKNLGRGSVIASQQYNSACSGRPLGEEGWNVVDVSATLSEIPLSCSPEKIRLKKEGETKIVCRLEEGIESRLGAYTAPLAVTLDYGYMNSISTQLKIVRIE